jgi:DNA modification methylase
MIEKDTLYCMDALDFINQFPDKSIDLCFCDPPYNVSHKGKIFKDYRRKNGDEVRSQVSYDYGKWDYGYDPIPFLNAAADKLVDGGSFVIFTSEQLYGVYRQWAEDREDMLPKQQLIWLKSNPVPNFRKVSHRQATELMIWISKGKISTKNPNFIFTTQQDSVNYRFAPICGGRERVKDPVTGKRHPNQKPLSICEWVISMHCREHGLVVDPYCGVGSIPLAAKQLNRRFVGNDLDESYLSLAKTRLYT